MDLFNTCTVVQAAFYVAFELGWHLIAQSVNGSIERRRAISHLGVSALPQEQNLSH